MGNTIQTTIKPGALSEAQAAQYIGISPSTMAEWRKDGIGPKYKEIKRIGKEKPRYLYPVKFLNEWLEAAAVTA